MSGPARTVIFGLSGLSLFAGALMLFEGNGGGIGLLFLGVLLVIGIAFEARYGRPGQQPSAASIDWQPTGEKFIDDETGEPIEVWIDKLTGERRYEPIRDERRLPRP